MPWFYFDVRVGECFTPDEEGVEFDSLNTAEHGAATMAAEIGRERFPKGEAHEVTIEVRDEDRFLLTTVTVSMTARRTIRALERQA